MFLQRALISFTLGPLALYVIYLGGWYYFLAITIILLLATVEYASLIQRTGLHIHRNLLVFCVFLVLVASQWLPHHFRLLAFAVTLGILIFAALMSYEKRQSSSGPMQWMALTLGLVLLGWVGGHFLLLRNVGFMAWQWTMLAMLSTWLTDSAAYVVGRFLAGKFLLGRHQLSPRLSPNKTIEGYVGGIILGTLLTAAISKILLLPLLPAILLGLLISVFSTIGDLSISLLKREAGVKDSGKLFAGHGGALDRIDSLLWSVTIAYYMTVLLT